MTGDLVKTRKRGMHSLQGVVLATAALLFLVIVTDDFAQRTGVGKGFSEWLLAPTALLIVIAATSAWRSFREARWVRWPLAISLLIVTVQVFLLGFRLGSGGTVGSVAAYFASAMIVHALVLTATVVAFRYKLEQTARITFQTPFARMTVLLLAFIFLTLASGSYVTISGAATMCQGWPFCSANIMPQDPFEWISLLHRITVGITGLLMVQLLFLGWKTQRFQAPTLVMLTVVAILFLAQGLVGALMSMGNTDVALVALHVASGAAVWGATIVLTVHVGLEGRTVEFESVDAFQTASIRNRFKDYLALTKPVIVLLLLATTVAGMVVGAKAWPSFELLFWTVLGGAFAAGGSGAINQFIDRDVDARMKRTSRRPLAAGRLTPAEGLAFGIGLCLTAFYLLAVFVNLLAALLSVVGMFYYVWLYSLILKKSTVQNIVIGGGAGAIPPLVGWAAATGGLTLPALLLFVIIFFWTPPHFWALALVRTKDYARGGIPMLPVVRGEKETRKQILIYTVELVVITLLAPLVGLSGVIYVAGALVLGAWLTWTAWRLWVDYTPRQAWKMYRYSSMYLLLLFVVMMVDALI